MIRTWLNFEIKNIERKDDPIIDINFHDDMDEGGFRITWSHSH